MNAPLKNRTGTTMTELVVAATLMVSALGIVAPLTVRSGRMWQESRQHELVLEELTNEFERLASLSPQQRELEMAELEPSEHLLHSLPSAKLSAKKIHDSNGTRLVMSVDWDRRGHPKPISLIGWIDPMPSGVDSRGSKSEETAP